MAPTPIKVRGKRKASAAELPGKRARTGPAARAADRPGHAVVPRRARPKPVPLDRRLPLEILERIFLLSANVNLAWASPLLSVRLSGHGTLVELAVAAFAGTWAACAYGHDDDTPPGRAGDPAFQSAVLACPWAKADLLLDAQQLWRRRHGRQPHAHLLAPASSADATATRLAGVVQDAAALAALQRAHTAQAGCSGWHRADAPDGQDGGGYRGGGNAPLESTGPPPPAARARPHVRTCFALEMCLFVAATQMQEDTGSPPDVHVFGHGDGRTTRADVHPQTRIPERLLGGPFLAGRLRHAAHTLFWLVRGGARLHPLDSWEVTRQGFRELLEGHWDGDGDRSGTRALDPDPAALSHALSADLSPDLSPDRLAAAVVTLLAALGVFAVQWPVGELHVARRQVRARAADDAAFARSHTRASMEAALAAGLAIAQETLVNSAYTVYGARLAAWYGPAGRTPGQRQL